jgi:hypothetical protein
MLKQKPQSPQRRQSVIESDLYELCSLLTKTQLYAPKRAKLQNAQRTVQRGGELK